MSNQKPHETDSYRSVQRIPDPDRRAAKLERLRLRVLREMCEGFDGDPSTFASIVSWAVEVVEDGRRRIAGRLDLCLDTVERWSLANSLPYEDVQALVVDEIQEMAVEQLEGDQ